MRITEIFDSVYPYSVRTSSKWLWVVSFITDDKSKVMVSISAREDNTWDLMFDRTHDGLQSTERTGQGDQYKIFSTVIAILKEFDSVRKPSKVIFTASKSHDELGSRTQLYRTLCRVFAKDFTVKELDGIAFMEFELVRKGLVESQINELFDTKYQYKWEQRNNEEWSGSFLATDNTNVRLEIGQLSDEGEWYVSFTREYQGRGSVSATGQGDQVKIFSTIVAMLQEFEAQVKPMQFRFTTYKDGSEADSRPKLYRTIARTFAKNFNLVEKEGNGKIYFRLVRKPSLEETASAGATASGSVASSVGGLGAGFSDDYSKSIYGEPVVIRRNPKPKKRK